MARTLPVARAEPDRDIDAIGLEVGERLARFHVQIDERIAGRKTRQPRNQPASCHDRQPAHGDFGLGARCLQAAKRRVQF